MVKVLIVIPTLDQSGAEKQFTLLATQLPPEEFEVRVLALSRGGPLGAALNERGIPVSVLNKRWRLDPRTIAQVRTEIRMWRPDVVLSCLFAGNATARMAVAGLQTRPAMIIAERCVDSWKSGWQKQLDRILWRWTDLLIANSGSVADFYEKLGIPRERIQVIPNGVAAPALPSLTREQWCREINVPENAFLVTYVGRLAPQKRVRDLLWAAQLLRQAEPRAYLLVVGEGPERDELKLFARDVEVTQHVRFLGHRTDAASLLHLTDVFWLASEFEGMSNSLMEAMACGKPVVVSDIPPNRELVQHERQGYLVALGDSPGFAQFTGLLLNDANLASEMGRAGRESMQSHYSTEAMVNAYGQMLHAAAVTRQPGRARRLDSTREVSERP